MEKTKRSFAELDFFEVYRECMCKNLIEVTKKYGLEKEDIEFVLNRVEKTVCGINSFSGNLTKTARQCGLSEKVVRKILVKGGRFISDSKTEAYKFLCKKEKF